jgi:hypothetical protein
MYPDLRVTQEQAYAMLFEIRAAVPNGTFSIDISQLDPSIIQINGKPVAELQYLKAMGPGAWAQLQNGYPTWVLTPQSPKPTAPAPSGAGLAGTQNAGEDPFHSQINATPGSIAEKVAAVDKAVADLKSELRAKGAL